MLLVIGCFLGVALVYPEVPPDMRRGALALAVAAVLGFVVLALMQRHRARAEAILGRMIGWLSRRLARRVAPLIASFMNGLGGLADLPTVLLVLTYSAYLWGVIALTYLFSFLALDMHVPLVRASLATVVVVAAMVFLPQAPGFLGTWQAGCLFALGWFHVDHEVPLGYSFLTWIIQMMVNITPAGVFLAREDLPLRWLLLLASHQ